MMMDKIQPYLFWIVCGVLLSVELILIVVLEPVNSNNKTAVQAAEALNNEFNTLRTRIEPVDAFSTGVYLPFSETPLQTKMWLPILNKINEDLDTHKSNIERELQKRSEILHVPLHVPVKKDASR